MLPKPFRPHGKLLLMREVYVAAAGVVKTQVREKAAPVKGFRDIRDIPGEG
jgi:hypothetical protein